MSTALLGFPEDPRGRELILMIERAKYERWLSGQVSDMLARAFNEVVDTILSPNFRTLSVTQQQRKLQLFRELDRIIQRNYGAVTNTVLNEMHGYAQLEAEVAAAQIESVLDTETIEVSLNAMLTGPSVRSIAELPIQGLSIGDWFEAQAAGMSRETRRAIQNGLLQGKSIPEIASAIVPPRNSVNPAVFRRARNEGTLIARTTVNAVQNNAAVQSYLAAGGDVSDSYRFVAVRDSRTTPICRAADGKIFRNDDPTGLRPPLHIGCRSTVVPIVNDAFLTKKDQKEQPLTFSSYGQWLGTQSSSVQDSILGPTRADLWRAGTMTLADAVDQDNRTLSLAELRKRLSLTRRVPAGSI
jgi:SPP1 gp7 family putative phage head morphogenesis protein